jgi:hypothetical protein
MGMPPCFGLASDHWAEVERRAGARATSPFSFRSSSRRQTGLDPQSRLHRAAFLWIVPLFHRSLASLDSAIGDESVKVLAAKMETPMRDIRTDLRQRLAANAAAYSDEIAEYNRQLEAIEKSHKETLTTLGRERAALEQLLALENERHDIPGPTLAQKIATLVPLGDFLVTKLQAHGPMEKEQLRAEARLAGYAAAGNGRAFHITLLNVTKCGRLVHLPDGRYAYPERPATTLFGSDDQPREGAMQ